MTTQPISLFSQIKIGVTGKFAFPRHDFRCNKEDIEVLDITAKDIKLKFNNIEVIDTEYGSMDVTGIEHHDSLTLRLPVNNSKIEDEVIFKKMFGAEILIKILEGQLEDEKSK